MAQIHRLVEPMKKTVLSRGYGQVVCVLAFTSNDPSSNSAEVHSSAGFELGPVNFCEKNKLTVSCRPLSLFGAFQNQARAGLLYMSLIFWPWPSNPSLGPFHLQVVSFDTTLICPIGQRILTYYVVLS